MTTPAATRLSRLLAVVAHLSERGGRCTLSELSDRFGLEPEAMEAELWMAACCGLPPYTPDTLIDMNIYDDVVEARIPYYFKRPQQLSSAEGFALLAAGQAMLAIPGADDRGPLASALQKLGEALGASEGLEVDLMRPEHLDVVRAGAQSSRRLAISYYSPDSDEVVDRKIDPYVVFSEDGRWYVRAHDHLRDAIRTFRVDRIRIAEQTDETFQVPAGATESVGAFSGGPDSQTVRMIIPATARWVVETYPVESWEANGGEIHMTLAVSSERWLERLLLRVGPDARVEEPEHMRGLAGRAAVRLLDRYR